MKLNKFLNLIYPEYKIPPIWEIFYDNFKKDNKLILYPRQQGRDITNDMWIGLIGSIALEKFINYLILK